MQFLAKLKQQARQLKIETKALYLAGRHPDTPWYAKLLVVIVVGYALSPIDLIPDFIPVLGYLDDLILVPLGLALAIRLVPPAIMNACRDEACKAVSAKKPRSMTGAVIVVLIWLATAIGCLIVLRRCLKAPG